MRQAVEAPHLPHGTLQEGSARRARNDSMCSGSAYVDIDWAQLMSALLQTSSPWLSPAWLCGSRTGISPKERRIDRELEVLRSLSATVDARLWVLASRSVQGATDTRFSSGERGAPIAGARVLPASPPCLVSRNVLQFT